MLNTYIQTVSICTKKRQEYIRDSEIQGMACALPKSYYFFQDSTVYNNLYNYQLAIGTKVTKGAGGHTSVDYLRAQR